MKNENIKLDWDFKVSLLSDAVRVSTKKTPGFAIICVCGDYWGGVGHSKCQRIKIIIDRSFKFVILITK